MIDINHALRAGLGERPLTASPAPEQPPSGADAHTGPRRAVVLGGVGPLGGAVLAQLMADGGFAQVAVPVSQPVAMALRGLVAWPLSDWAVPPTPLQVADTAVAVFDRVHGLHGREAALVRPDPSALLPMGRWLLAAGVRRLVLVLPQSPTLLPQALRQGLADLDEQALSTLGFEHLVIVRPARTPGAAPAAAGTSPLQRLAHTLLAQLGWMVPAREQPLRARVVAQWVSALVRALPAARPGTRVAPPELLWDWAQPGGGEPVLAAWLATGTWAAPVLPARRW